MNLFSIFQTTLIVLCLVLAGVFLFVMFSHKPSWSFTLFGVSGSGNQKYEVLKFLGIGMGGILVALQALMSYKRAKALEDTAKHTEQGQRQERMKNAIEHLGHESDSVRLGGAYELFHLAEDTEEWRQTVLDILCAHIRQTTGEDEYREKHKSKPSEEVQSLLTLLFVQEYEVFKGLHINLQESWLNGANLREARLCKAVLTRVHLKRAKLDRAHLQRANLVEAHLEEAYLSEAWLQEANLFCVRMQGANLKKARLQGANLDGAHLQAAYFPESHMQGAYLNSARLQGATLSSARLQGANLASAGLPGSGLDRVCLQGVGSQAWSSSTPFADRIRMSIGKETDLSGVWFGGIKQGGVDLLTEGLSPGKAARLQMILQPHISQPVSYELPEDSGAITGTYTEEDAEKWISEYEEAMSEVSGDNSSCRPCTG